MAVKAALVGSHSGMKKRDQTSLKMAVKAALVGSHSGMKKRDQTSLGGP